MLPPFTADGVLPPGIYQATWPDVVQRFGTTDHRRALLVGLRHLLLDLQAAGCRRIYLDGSFVTDEPEPNDYDLGWDEEGVEVEKLDMVIRRGMSDREGVHRKYGGDVLPVGYRPSFAGWTVIEFSQLTKGRFGLKGIVIMMDPEAVRRSKTSGNTAKPGSGWSGFKKR